MQNKEMQFGALNNALNSLNEGFKLHYYYENDKRKKAQRFYITKGGVSCSPTLEYNELNHFILGMIKYKDFSEKQNTQSVTSEYSVNVTHCEESDDKYNELRNMELSKNFSSYDDAKKYYDSLVYSDKYGFESDCTYSWTIASLNEIQVGALLSNIEELEYSEVWSNCA